MASLPTFANLPDGLNSMALFDQAFAYVQGQNQAVNPVFYGADPTGAVDSAPAIRLALAASSYIKFPPGKFRVNSQVTYNIPTGLNSVSIEGSGQDQTILYSPSGVTIFRINYLGGASNGAHIRNLSITTGTTATGNGILLNNVVPDNNPANTADTDISFVTFRGDDGYGGTDYWANALNIVNVSNINVLSCFFIGGSGTQGNGIQMIGLPASTTYGVVYNICQCNFLANANGIVIKSYLQGITIDQTNFTQSATGILVQGGGGTEIQLAITNSEFGVYACGINLGDYVNDVTISGCTIFNSSSPSILASFTNNLIIIGNFFGSSGGLGTAISLGTSIAGSSNQVAHNIINGFGIGVLLNSGTLGAVIIGNSFNSVNTPISNSSADTNNIIAYNPGYDAQTNPGQIAYAFRGINLAASTTDHAVSFILPAGVTRYSVQIARLASASTDIHTGTCGLFTATGGGGQTIAADQSITITQSAADTNNNSQNLTITNTSTESYTDTTLQFRVGTGVAGTVDFILIVVPL